MTDAINLSFSTLGCPTWTLDEVIARADEYAYQGVEVRGLEGEFDLCQIPAFQRDAAPDTRERFARAGLQVVVLGLSCKLSSADEAERHAQVRAGYEGIKLAQRLGVPYVRVFGGSVPEGAKKEDAIGWVGDGLRALAEYGDDRGVMPLLETHDAWVLGEDVEAVLERAEHRQVGVIWDVRHTHHAGEPLADTHQRLRRWIRHVHVKDEGDDGYCLLGEGRVPNQTAMRLLLGDGYTGYFSLEWEKAWHPELAEPDDVFPQFVGQMRRYEQDLT